MGQGIQQPQVQQNGGNAFANVFKVLLEPTAVFESVRAKPSFLAPYLVIMAAQIILFFVNLPILRVAIKAQMANAPAGRPVPSDAMLAIFGIVGLIVVLTIVFCLSGLILWMLTSILGGGEAKFSTMLSVTLYSAIPAAVLLSIVGTIVIHLQGTGNITSPNDMQPALGLDLLSPGAKGFVGAVLKGINPFSLWSLALTAIGVSTTQRIAKSSGWTIAVVGFVISLIIGGALAAAFNR
jgi:hypothetical protein